MPILSAIWRRIRGSRRDMLMGVKRSGAWRTLEKHLVALMGHCECCGAVEELEAHHVEPFREDPKKELDPRNVIILCRECHYLIGHLRNWKGWNPKVREWAAMIFAAIQENKKRITEVSHYEQI